MSFDLQLFSGKLNKCRTNLQLDISEVCSKLSFTTERLVGLEKGSLMPTGDEILIFADFYKQDYKFFITNEYKTVVEKIQILYRKHGNAFSKTDRLAIQEFIYLCECEQLVFDLSNTTHLSFDPHLKGTYFIGHGIDTAKALRIKLGLQPENLINDPYQLFRKLGIHIFRRRLENSAISGLFFMHPRAGRCILVNYDEDIYRQNFTVVHEVGHALFDSGEEINISFSTKDKIDLKETRANAFASNFLIPEEELLKRKNIVWHKDVLMKFACQLNVNIQPLVIALKTAKLIDTDHYKVFMKLKVPMSQKIDPELYGLSNKRCLNKAELLARGLSDHYVKACYLAYEKGLISAQRLSEMFLVNEDELIKILPMFNLKLIYEY